MALILHIDTATSFGSVCLSKDGKELETLHNADQKDHAATVGLFIRRLLEGHGVRHEELGAIAVSAGPGSYTGLRVGAATAKGLCYAWKKPLIAISTLQMMASGLQSELREEGWYVPMIDARRMEVFTAVYDAGLKAEMPPQSMILTPESFASFLDGKTTYFFGDGAPKWRSLLGSPTNAVFPAYQISAAHMVPLAEKAFASKDFQDVAYFAPHYLKAFFTPGKP
ncbi:tRNA (adenosine(37)-N6)-threonylcarbamoyltransferase complex dimerization subunit type 1 TsaB [Chitinophaga sp. GCM10012297]|uniref:N(6)-L-threonylcarbamoyladenine synthase n=1 Tax=Chitinophaga chungangae TaxID=2821488 RepID=A0ABS3YDC9_9BACT|nr:tRNA (adenosine(37)-N6)-threonylcarbamoyltransferase complex dimerization subunit type 1 TsaB [Chitinophaga chungangae]MBO9152697.1 tRNA (adenosine(37)-N6)-threonylcarbamoyltransferase complex dimerization subunit type 1 TsaB [Chitinophaga chungangae]